MNCIIIDDDEASRNLLIQLIKQVKELELIKVYSNPVEAFNVIQDVKTDLVFLDVEMPEFSGIEMLKAIEVMPQVILTSSHTKYALDAFDLNVVDYLVKPISLDRCMKAISKVSKNLKRNSLTNVGKDFLFIKKNSVLEKVLIKDILWIEAFGDYTKINTKDQRFIIHSTLKSLEDKLPADKFVRSHRSYIIQIDSVKMVEDTTAYINDVSIPIGTMYKENFIRRLHPLD